MNPQPVRFFSPPRTGKSIVYVETQPRVHNPVTDGIRYGGPTSGDYVLVLLVAFLAYRAFLSRRARR